MGGIAKNIGDKTGEMLAVNKLNSKIHAEQQAAAEELRKIGEYYYNLFLSGGQTAPEIAEFCQSAKSHYDEAAQTAAQTPAAPDGTVCPSCGASAAPGVKFCPECGAPLSRQSE